MIHTTINKHVHCFYNGLILLLLTGFFLPSPAIGKIKLGESCALSGPTAFLGTEMNKGAQAYFSRHASTIQLIAKDDGYEPDRCRNNTKAFIRDKVTALFGYVGTPTSKVAVPLATMNKVIFFGAFTGASFLSDVKKNPYSFSVRGSYNSEIENMMRHLKNDLNISRVALFVQRDAFGLAGIKGAMRADKLIDGITVFPKLPAIPGADAEKKEWQAYWRKIPNYRRNTVAVGMGVRQVWGNRAEAVIFVGAYTPCAAAINKLRERGFNGPVINISFVGSKRLAKRLRKTDNVFISQVVPNPWDDSIPVVKEYQQSLGGHDFGFVSLEGYLAAKIMEASLESIQGNINSDSIRQSLEIMSDYDIGGINITFGPDDHRGMDSVYLSGIIKQDNKIRFTYVDNLAQ